MTNSEAARILESLARGEDPQDLKPLSPHDVLARRDVIGALFLGANALQKGVSATEVNAKRELPIGAGKPWGDEEDKNLIDEFHANKSIADMASDHARTEGGIRSRLVRLGLMPERRVDPRKLSS